MRQKVNTDALKALAIIALAFTAIILLFSEPEDDSITHIIAAAITGTLAYLLANKWLIDEEDEQTRQAFDDEDTRTRE